jgi:hypothetical protein
MRTAVYLEIGTKKVFACALAWPGWARSAKTEDEALEALAAYADRYKAVTDEAGVRFGTRHTFDIVERVKGDATTDFGAPHKPAKPDGDPLTKANAARLATLVEASWAVFDRVVANAPLALRKGPRGGGRDRDKIVAHVAEAEKAYAQKMGLPPKERDRASITAALRGAVGDVDWAWPPPYVARRIAWHVLDHAWEIEDKSD